MPNYGASFAGGSAPALDLYAAGVNYGTEPQGVYATQSGPDYGFNDVTTSSGLAYPNGMTQWNAPGGYWNDPNYLAATGKAGNPKSRYLNPGGANQGTPVPGSPGKTINPNDPTQRYQAVNIPKSPDINAQVPTLLDEFKQGADNSLSGFSDYLKTFQDALNNAFSATKKANDPTATIDRLNAGQARYSAGLDKAATDYATLNQNTAAAEQGIVKQAQDLLPSYDTAANAAADIAMQNVQKQVNRYKAGSGAPTGLSSSELAQVQAGDASILVPLQQAKIQQAYSVLQNYSLPTTIDIANRETQRVASFTPQILAQQFQSGQATAEAVQALLQQTAQMSMQDATQYMQAIGVPAEIQQKILTGQISQLGAINSLEDQSNYRGLQDVLGVQPTQATYSSPSTGAYPTPGQSRYGGAATYNPLAAGGGGTSTGTQQPAAAPQGAVGDWMWDGTNNRWQNWKTGAISMTGPYTGQSAPVYPGTQGGYSEPISSVEDAYNTAQFS